LVSRAFFVLYFNSSKLSSVNCAPVSVVMVQNPSTLQETISLRKVRPYNIKARLSDPVLASLNLFT